MNNATTQSGLMLSGLNASRVLKVSATIWFLVVLVATVKLCFAAFLLVVTAAMGIGSFTAFMLLWRPMLAL